MQHIATICTDMCQDGITMKLNKAMDNLLEKAVRYSKQNQKHAGEIRQHITSIDK